MDTLSLAELHQQVHDALLKFEQFPYKATENSMLFHAWESGVHNGLLQHGQHRDNPYMTSKYRFQWGQGFVTGNKYRDYQNEIDALRAVARKMVTFLTPEQISAIENDTEICELYLKVPK